MAKRVGRATRRAVLGGIAGTAALAAAYPLRAATSGDPVRIGSTLALTGPLAQTSLINQAVGEVYVELLNKKNGLLGRPVEWVLYDDQSKPDVARTLYEKLVTVDKVDLIIGPYATGNILAANTPKLDLILILSVLPFQMFAGRCCLLEHGPFQRFYGNQ